MRACRRRRVLTLALIAAALPAWPAEVRGIKRKPAVEAREHPEAVLITARSDDGRKTTACTGSLIAPNVVLTAAHCADGLDVWEVVAPYARPGPARAVARTARVQPQHRPGTLENDLALLILDSVIDIGRKFPVLHDGELYPLDTELAVVGRVANGSLAGDRLYRSPVVAVVSYPGNINIYGGDPPVAEKGDSGGPVYLADDERRIVGVVSGHAGQSLADVAKDVYVPLGGKQREWIREVLTEARRHRPPEEKGGDSDGTGGKAQKSK